MVLFKKIFLLIEGVFYCFHIAKVQKINILKQYYCIKFFTFCQKNMSIRAYFLFLFCIFGTSSISLVLLWFYMNPANNPELAFLLLFIGFFLFGISLLIPLIFFAKKIYYRGDVNLGTMNASVRQGILFMIGIIAMCALHLYQIHEMHFILAIWATVGCLEVMIQVLD